MISLRLGRVVRADRPCDPAPLAAFSAVGGRIATVCGDGRVAVSDAASGFTVTARIPPLRILRPTSAGLARDGHTLVVGGVTGDLIQVDLRDGHAVGPRRILDGPIIRVDLFGASQRVVVLAGEHGGAHVWDLEAGAELLRLPVATSLSFRVDSRGLLTGGSRAGRWEFGDAVLAVSPDGRYLLGARSDGTVAVWRSSDHNHVATLRGHRQRVSYIVFAPDGLLSTAGWDGQILTWDLSALHTPAAGLVRRAEHAWAARLPLALRSDAR